MGTLDQLKNLIPSRLRRRVVFPVMNQVGAFLIDAGNRILGQYDDTIPPTRMHFVGNGSFKAAGYEFLRYFVEFGKLRPDERVLDVGCGIGRMALPLTNYLKQGRYLGIDIVPRGITWCRENITPRFPHFEFQLADIYNDAYNPGGRYKASEYRFPADDGAFDFAFLTSVFTHLLPADAAHYLAEIGRVLRPGGRVLGTWFVLNDESRALMATTPRALNLAHVYEGDSQVRVVDTVTPESAIGFDQERVTAMHAAAGLRIVDPIRFGSWCGRADYVSYQDIVLAERT
jgi:SAM-dependent methyltransferase